MEGTLTLADALLDDLDDLDDLSDAAEEEEEESTRGVNGGGPSASTLGHDGEVDHHHSANGGDWWPHRFQKRFLDDPTLHQHLEHILNQKRSSNVKQEHELLVKSNQYLSGAANDLSIAHDALCAAYRPRFPELEELIVTPAQYLQCVRILGNQHEIDTVLTSNKTVQDAMAQFLTQHQIVTLSVSSSTTAGRRLTDEEWHCVDQIATYMEQVLNIQGKLTQYIAQQMETLAPSVCALVGPKVAAKLVALTGGLPQLAKIPACNLQVLGQAKHTSSSRSTTMIAGSSLSSAAVAVPQQPHQGVLVECDLVQRSPRTMRSKALKLVAAKLALAVRHDHVNVDTGRPRSAEAGLQFRMQIEQKLVQLQEPDKAPVLKALPK